MPDRSVALSPRKESVREKNEVASVVVQFELEQIKKHFYDSLSDIKHQFSIADQLCSVGQNDLAKDVWRSQIVFLEGILDFYIHELSKYALVKMFTGKWSKSTSYENFMIPMSTVEEGLKNPESTSWLFERLNTRFSSETYLAPEPLGKQLSLIGMKLDDICKKAFPKIKGQTYVKGQEHLKSLFNRRNQIAHQADRKHTNAEKDEIDKKYVQESIDFVTKFIEAVHNEALSKEQ
jgi:hypothetical protein